MPRPSFVNNNFYHIYNRGVEKRNIFSRQDDYFRFIHDLYEFNDSDSTVNVCRRVKTDGSRTSISKKRKLLVDVVCFCLMPNHFHLLLKQRVDGGISKFIQKLGTGYTNYFNTKYERSGVLFQGKFKAVAVTNDVYLTHLSRYIHLNPLELRFPDWKEEGIKNIREAQKYLESYRWSSYLDYVDMHNYPSVIQKDFLMDYYNNKEGEYKKFINEWIEKDLSVIKDFVIER